MKREQRIYLQDIAERIKRIERYTEGGKQAFLESDLIQDGVIRSFEVIEEAVKRLDPTLTSQKPEIPWGDFAGFRDILIHQYHKVKPELIWGFIQEDLPKLKSGVEILLNILDTSAADTENSDL